MGPQDHPGEPHQPAGRRQERGQGQRAEPAGGFRGWICRSANTNWFNAHNFYGDLEHLDAATLSDVQQFFKTYYAPNNAVSS